MAAENLEPFFSHALKAIRAGARLERAAAEEVGAGLLHLAGDFVENLFAFDCAGAGDHQ